MIRSLFQILLCTVALLPATGCAWNHVDAGTTTATATQSPAPGGELPPPSAEELAALRDFSARLDKGEKLQAPEEAHEWFFLAARAGDNKLIQKMKKHGLDINARDPQFLATPLETAVLNNDFPAVEALLKNDADINAQSQRSGSFPLYAACNLDNVEMVRLLLKKGANPNLAEFAFGLYPLHSAASDGKIEILRLLIHYKANLNVTSSEGITPLHLAVSQQRADLAEELLKHGANVNAKTKAGTTPLDSAVNRQSKEIVEMLKKQGAVQAVTAGQPAEPRVPEPAPAPEPATRQGGVDAPPQRSAT